MEDEREPKPVNEGEVPTDDEIIELTDEVDLDPQSDEEVIELTDVVGEPAAEIAEASVASGLAEAEEVLEVSPEEKKSSKPAERVLEGVISLDDAVDDELEVEQDSQDSEDEFVGSLGMDLEAEDEKKAESVSVSPGQIEEALERVVRKMFSEKIESILVEVIEKTVAREIEKMKNILLEDTRRDEE